MCFPLCLLIWVQAVVLPNKVTHLYLVLQYGPRPSMMLKSPRTKTHHTISVIVVAKVLLKTGTLLTKTVTAMLSRVARVGT